DMKAENIRDSGGAADDCHVALVEIVKRRYVLAPFQPLADGLGSVGPALNRHLRYTRQRLVVFPFREGEISGDENVRVTWQSEVRLHFDAAAPIGFGVRALAQLFAERGDYHAARPQNGLRGNLPYVIALLVGDAVSVDPSDHHAFANFNAKFLD